MDTSLDGGAKLDRLAYEIDDPIERLRFLRLAASRSKTAHVPPPGGPSGRRHRSQVIRFSWLAFSAMLALAPGPRPRGSAGTFAQERMLLAASPVAGARTTELVQDHAAEKSPARVWRVTQTETSEVYSNGLQIDLSFQATNRTRPQYPIYSLTGGVERVKTGDRPAGIVFHTTESLLAPFEEGQNGRLKQIGRNLIELIRTNRAYHYVIDRFGRVFAVVVESDAANHAGHSIWAGAEGVYVNLNDSFLAVAFEAQTDSTDAVTPAQIAAGKLLTEMLRSRYEIDAANCVTHAQVSVNPRNMKIGEHVDWASDFPFAEMGLSDNYAIPLASVYAFGFKYDDTFLIATRSRWKGLDLAEDQVTRQAELEHTTAARYRAMLRHRYEEIEPRETTVHDGASGPVPAPVNGTAEAEGTAK